MASVQKAIRETAELMEIEFSNNQLFLLYLHCSCMIERILRKESVDDQSDIEQYKKENREDIEKIRAAFYDIEAEYTIQIPDLELRLLNDIIQG